MEENSVENNVIIPDMDGLPGNTPSYDIQEPVNGETVDRDFSLTSQKAIIQFVEAASKGVDTVSHEVSDQSMEEYPVENNAIIPDMDGLQGNTPSYDIQEPVNGETVDRDFSLTSQKAIIQFIEAASKGVDTVSHEVSDQSMEENPVENNAIISDMDGFQGNTPSYDIQEPVTGETVDRDFFSTPQKTIGQFMEAATKSIDILSHKAIVQSKESHMPRTLLTHPRVIRMFQVVGFESLSVSNPNLAVGRLTVLKKKRFVPYKKLKHIYIA